MMMSTTYMMMLHTMASPEVGSFLTICQHITVCCMQIICFRLKVVFFAMSAVRANCPVTSISSYREFQAVFRFKFLFTMFLFRFCKHWMFFRVYYPRVECMIRNVEVSVRLPDNVVSASSSQKFSFPAFLLFLALQRSFDYWFLRILTNQNIRSFPMD